MDKSVDLQRPKRFGQRHLQCALLFFMMFLCYSTRMVLSVGIVAMTDETINPSQPTYDWNNASIILSSFFWGYIVLQIPIGILVEKFGSRWILLTGMLINTFFFLMIPFLAEYGSWVVMFCRICQGLSQGVAFPCSYHMLGKWAPASERASLTSFVLAAMPIGSVVALLSTGWISASSLGWPFAFYFFSGLSGVWLVIWFFCGYNTPREYKLISESELKYIEASLGTPEKHPPPYKQILTSIPFWAIIMMEIADVFGFTTFITTIPTYFNSILEFDINSNGVLASLPYLIKGLLGFSFGFFVDWTINRRYLSVEHARKMATCVGSLIPVACLIVLGALYLDKNSTVGAVVLITISQSMGGCFSSGYLSNYMDLSPRFSGTVMSIANTIATIGSICGPLIVQFIVTDHSDASQWTIVFYLCAGILVGGLVIYLMFTTAEKQTWNEVPEQKNKSVDY